MQFLAAYTDLVKCALCMLSSIHTPSLNPSPYRARAAAEPSTFDAILNVSHVVS